MKAASLVFTVALCVPGTAAAYVDPGSGSVFFQAAIASLLAALFTLKVYWRRLKTWLAGRRQPEAPPTVISEGDGTDDNN